MIVLVELAEGYGYDNEESLYTYKEIGEVFGPFDTVEAASAYGEKLNNERGTYQYNGRTIRMDMRDFEVKEVTAP